MATNTSPTKEVSQTVNTIELLELELDLSLTFFTAHSGAMHLSAFALSWDRMSSVCLSVTLMICDHIGWKSWKLITQTISPAHSLFVAKRRSTYSQGNIGKLWGD